MKSKEFAELHTLLVSNDDKQLNRGYQILFKALRTKMIRHFENKYKLDEEGAQDLTHESLITIMEKAYTVEEPKAFVGWCWKVANNKALDYVRKINKEKIEFNTDNFDIEINKPKHSYVDNKDQRDCIRKGFEEFKEQHPQRADALELFAQGYMHAEIAPIINKTPGATKEFISQCRKIVDSFIGHCKEIK